MSEKPIIDIDAQVIPLEVSIAHPMHVLAVKRARGAEALFEQPVDPEMRGRRPSGIVFDPGQVPKEARGVEIETPPDVVIPKRAAKSVAEELTGLPVQLREKDGYSYIEVIWPTHRLEFHGRTWFHALASLKNHIEQTRRRA